MYKILLVDDDPNMLDMVEQLMEHEGHAALKARSGLEALRIAQFEKPDLCIIDVGMPHMDGVMLCKTIRTIPSLDEIPIIFLTAHNTNYSVADALEAGGDDYVKKPFAMRELAARVRAHLRRAKQADNIPVLQIMRRTYQVYLNQREIPLTRIEFDLLNYMCQEPGRWYSTQDLLSGVWDYPEDVGDAALVRNHIRNVRRKLEENPDKPSIVQSRHGRGYAVRAQVHIG